MITSASVAVIALGGNLPSPVGPPAQTLIAAIRAMPAAGLRLRAVSRFFHTPCFPAGAGPDFVNAVVAVESALPPGEILERLHAIERQLGRVREKRWGERSIDLDLLAVGDAVLPDAAVQRRWRELPPGQQAEIAPDQLVLPHPRLQERAFVLVPMRDIMPGWVHPLLGRDVASLCAALPPKDLEQVRPL